MKNKIFVQNLIGEKKISLNATIEILERVFHFLLNNLARHSRNIFVSCIAREITYLLSTKSIYEKQIHESNDHFQQQRIPRLENKLRKRVTLFTSLTKISPRPQYIQILLHAPSNTML